MSEIATAFDTLRAKRCERVAAIAEHRVAPLQHPRLDTSRWPVVVATIDSEADMASILDAVTVLHLRGPFALVVDVRRLRRLSAGTRHAIVAARLADAARFPGLRRSTAYVISGEEQRRLLLPLQWLSDSPCHEEQFLRLEFALAWSEATMSIS